MSVQYARNVAEELVTAGQRRVAGRDYLGALDLLKWALCVNPRHPVAANNIAIALVKTKKIDNGFGWFERTLRIDPSDDPARQNLAFLHLKYRNHHQALRHARTSAVMTPGSHAANRTVTEISRSSPRFEDFSVAVERMRCVTTDAVAVEELFRQRDTRRLHDTLDARWRQPRRARRPQSSGLDTPETDPNAAHILERIRSATPSFEPFAHSFVRDFLPELLFQEARRLVPDRESFLALPRELHPNRRSAAPTGEDGGQWWRDMLAVLHSDQLLDAMLSLFGAPDLRPAVENAGFTLTGRTRMTIDERRYSLGPHRDHWTRLCTGLIYVPGDSAPAHRGTAIYRRTRDFDFFDWGYHHPFDGFEKVATMPFLPNACLLFLNLGEPYHGVDPVVETGQRPLIQFSFHIERTH